MASSTGENSDKSPRDHDEGCKGVRVFYYDKFRLASGGCLDDLSDHSHTAQWSERLREIIMKDQATHCGCVEAGTIVRCWRDLDGKDIHLEVCWDCGEKREYSQQLKEWKNICLLDMGPAGYRSTIVLCDVCLMPVTGVSFRCTNESCSKGIEEVYDLCYRHYNLNDHLLDNHQFQCIMQTKFTFDLTRNMLPSRAASTKLHLVGLFPGAVIKDLDEKKGIIKKVVHKGGKKEYSMADAWDCTAEVQCDSVDELCYKDIGKVGKVEVFALEPGDGGPIYVEHFPKFGSDILKEISSFYKEVKKVKLSSNNYCYISQDPPSITISGTIVSKISKCDAKCVFHEVRGDLEVLNFLHNKLEHLPQQVLQYKHSLHLATLSFNCFDSIPTELFSCTELENINLIHNRITVLPKNINCLSNLTNLFIDCNSIRVLPEEICELNSLRALGLSCNLLISLPTSLSKLNYLHRLDLHHNHFKVFPLPLYTPENGLKNLKTLSLDNNRIQVIPESARPLIDRLSRFTIFNNPLQIKGALECSNAGLIELIKSRSSTSLSPRGHLRIIVLGVSGSGKSSLVKALVDREKYVAPVDEAEASGDHTVGIDQYSYRFSGINGEVYEVTLWDFAGEKAYAMMNQMFLSPGSLIWVVFDMSKYTDKCFEDSIGKWLRSVYSFVGSTAVWIIGTHADKCKSSFTDIKTDVEHQVLKHIIEKQNIFLPENITIFPKNIQLFAVSNAHDLHGHLELIAEIKKLPQPFFISFNTINDKWVTAQEYLSEEAANKLSKLQPPIMDKSTLLDILKKKQLVERKLDFDELMKYLHQAGEIFIFMEAVYLDPVWLIILLKEIFRIDVSEHIEKKAHKGDAHGIKQAIKSTAKISKQILKKLWESKGVTKDKFNDIVECLLQFGLAFEICDNDLLFPWLLPKADRIRYFNIPKCLRLGRCHVTLVYMFDYIPPAFFERLLSYSAKSIEVRCITKSHISAKQGDCKITMLMMFDNHADGSKGTSDGKSGGGNIDGDGDGSDGASNGSSLGGGNGDGGVGDYGSDSGSGVYGNAEDNDSGDGDSGDGDTHEDNDSGDDHDSDNDNNDLYKGYVVFIASNSAGLRGEDYSSLWTTLAHLTSSLQMLLSCLRQMSCPAIKVAHPTIKVACPNCVTGSTDQLPGLFDVTVLSKNSTIKQCSTCKQKIPAERVAPPTSEIMEDILLTRNLQENELLLLEILNAETHQDPNCMPTEKFLSDVASIISVQTHWKDLAYYLQLSIDVIEKFEMRYREDGPYEYCYQMLLYWKMQADPKATMKALLKALKKITSSGT